ncbi:divergent polysaccharide deacetylase family protein [Pontibacter sp. JAM-7]|uniref:divergent polysaccharide deacetylase family protein n=1 Tax=Pontibacter sp. JAM-7 TaxID=3366581 RepID=UPI003AF548DF
MKSGCFNRLLSLLLLSFTPVVVIAGEAEAVLVVIIDDIGFNHSLGQRAVDLPGPVSLAFLPHTPHAKSLAEQAFLKQRDILLHQPMQNADDRWLGDGGLLVDMSYEEKRSVLTAALASVPHVTGLNNHTGSILTADMTSMAELMSLLLEKNLFFVDSFTNPESQGWQVAHHAGLPYLIRDVFLDNETTPEALAGQYEKALQTAREQGFAVLIGHPYPETLSFLERELPQLTQQGITLIPASQLLKRQQRIPARLIALFCQPNGSVDCRQQ